MDRRRALRSKAGDGGPECHKNGTIREEIDENSHQQSKGQLMEVYVSFDGVVVCVAERFDHLMVGLRSADIAITEAFLFGTGTTTQDKNIDKSHPHFWKLVLRRFPFEDAVRPRQ